MSDDSLALDHMHAQVTNAAAIQTLAGELWRRGIDPHKFVDSYDRIRPALVALVLQGRRRAARIADGYYGDLMVELGLDTAALAAFTDDLDAEVIAAAVDGTARRNVTVRALDEAALAASTTARDEALQAALGGMLAMVKGRVASGGTDRLLGIARADRRVSGWARISDGSPCYRCALLLSRGPVYTSESTAGFNRHDGCGCSAKLIVGDASGWTAEAKAYRSQWDAERDLDGFRANLTHTSARFDPLAKVSLSRFAPTG